MKFHDTSRPLYLEIDACDIGLGNGLLQVREEMNCGGDKTQDSATLHQIAFASKYLLSVKQ